MRCSIFTFSVFVIVFFFRDQAIHGKDYEVWFDTWPHANSLAASIGKYNYSTPSNLSFKKWGSSWSNGDPDGSMVTNRDENRRTIVSMHFRVVSDRDSFVINSSAAGRLFTEVWVKKNNNKIVEAVFSGAAVPTGSSLWNLVKPGTPSNPYSNFEGYWSDQHIVPGPGWEKIYPDTHREDEQEIRWLRLISACPNDYRTIQTYGESPDKNVIAFVSDGRLLVYDDSKGDITAPVVRESLPRSINHISVEEKEGSHRVLLFANGVRKAEVSLKDSSEAEVIGKVPNRVSIKE